MPAAWRGLSETGVEYDLESLYDRLQQIPDPRQRRGRRYSLLTLLVLIVLAKLCCQDSPVEIADWCANHADDLQRLLKLERSWMPHHNTIRRVFQQVVSADALEALARACAQSQPEGPGRVVLSLDGKSLRGTKGPDRESPDHLLSVYDGQQVLAQEAVAGKENEITAAPRVLQGLKLSQKVVVGDAMHTQRALSAQILAAGGD